VVDYHGVGPVKRSLSQRVWSRIDKSGGPTTCWPWTGARTKAGYGRIHVEGTTEFVHRVVMTLTTGGPIPNGLFVLHSCDNPPCANPAHLRIGTSQDNANDMVSRNRSGDTRNEKSGRAKLTNWQVTLIRRSWIHGVGQASIARIFGVHPAHVSRIVREVRRPSGLLPDAPLSVDWKSKKRADRAGWEALYSEAATRYSQGQKMAKIAEDLGCHKATLSRRLRRLGVVTRTATDYEKRLDLEEVRRLHATNVRVKAMARQLGVGPNRINAALEELNLPRFGPGNPHSLKATA
jgi:transposase-like protein